MAGSGTLRSAARWAIWRNWPAIQGGRVINVGNDGREAGREAFNQIQDELRTQYLASYTPKNNTEADGKFRKLDYDCGKGRKIEARKGYYAIAGDADSQ